MRIKMHQFLQKDELVDKVKDNEDYIQKQDAKIDELERKVKMLEGDLERTETNYLSAKE